MPPKGIKRKHTELEGLRGGHRQRAAESAALATASASSSRPAHSELARFLLSSYFLGAISLPFLVQCASLAFRETPGHPDLQVLAGLGTSGANAQSYGRDLRTRMQTFACEAALMTVMVPAKILNAIKEISMEVIYPHAMFARLFSSYPEEFGRRFFNNRPESISAFWDDQRDHPSYRDHPMLSHEFGRAKSIPIFLHGDDVAAVGVGKVWARAVDVLSWGSLVGGAGTASAKHLLIWLVYNNILGTDSDGRSTMQILWRHVVWSLYWLFRGRWPTHSPDGVAYVDGIHAERAGKPLAGEWFCTLWNTRFDGDWGQSQLGATVPGNSCMSCNATDGGARPWTDCRNAPSNSWIPTCWTNATHAAHFGNERHRLLRVLPGFGQANVIPDILHNKWLGADQYFFGSTLALLTHHHMDGSPAENIQAVMNIIRVAYTDEHVALKDRYPSLRTSQYKPARVRLLPKLKGTGQQCKGLSKVLPAVFASLMDPEDEGHVMVLFGLRCIRETNLLIEEHYHCHRFPAAAADRFVELSFLIAQTTTALINRYHPHSPLFHYTIKQHYTLHCALCSRYTSPLHGDCSSGEVLMKTVKQLVKGCLAGNAIHKVGNVALRKYLKGFHLSHDPSSAWWKF